MEPSIDIYGESYWAEELAAAKERSFVVSLARAAEVFVLCTRVIDTFLDIGTGPGYFLDAVTKYLPDSTVNFLGVEMYPPDEKFRSTHSGYRVGWLKQFEDSSIDAGICIEVLEHLTPHQVRDLFQLLYLKASSSAAFIFNTGLTDYVKNEDMGYLDKAIRGHISIWSVKAIRELVGDLGWQVSPIPKRSWAFLAEKESNSEADFSSRIWVSLPENVNSLCGQSDSKLLYLLGRDSLRAV